jgi:tetratricopeptide (TPR) repeat protein
MRVTAPLASMSLAAGLALVVAWQGVNLWKQPHSIPMPMSSAAPRIRDLGVQFGVTSDGSDKAPRAPSEAPPSSVAADEANPVGVVAKEPRGDGADAGLQNPPSVPQVDETALRYFARQGDVRRLNAEIARLHSLYPDWRPPQDPLKAPEIRDPQLDHMWQLVAKGQLSAVREAIAARQSVEAGWTPPRNLVDRLALADLRERLINASDLKQYAMVIQIAAANPSLRTCGDVEALWRVAEAFVRTDSQARALDAYRYILTNCTNGPERIATMQKAADVLPRGVLDPLFGLARAGPEADEVRSIREDLARRAISAGASDAKADVSEEDIATVERLAKSGQTADDPMLLGWYFLRRGDPTQAERWFRVSYDRKHAAESAQGLSLALVLLKRPEEAEDTLAPYRGADDDAGKAYMAAATSLLAQQPAPVIASDVLARIVETTAKRRDSGAAQQLGWLSRAHGQEETAAQWFSSALAWKPDDEPSAYGLAVVDSVLKRREALLRLVRVWGARSPRMLALLDPGAAARARVATAAGVATTTSGQAEIAKPASQEGAAAPRTGRAPAAEIGASVMQNEGGPIANRRTSAPGAGCGSTGAGMSQAWCLMQLDRPGEAALAFRAILSTGTSKERQDAAYGLSLAELRAGLTADAEVAGSAARQPDARVRDLRLALVTQRITEAYNAGSYADALIYLDARARMQPEPVNLMKLRGWSYFHLRRYEEATRIFEAVVASSGDEDALSALNVVKAALKYRP